MHARDYQPGEPVPGTVYRVLRRIGAGGMGTVYDVEDTTIGKRYVLKTLHPQLGAREDLARRMKNEARTLARLNHPNIVEVFTAGVTLDDLRLPYYVMERLNGQSLRLVLEKKGQLDRPHAYHIGIDLLDALDHAHDKGVIHRDVKPDNIFLHRTTAGVTLTKLLDFGIVSVLDGGARDTAGRFLGTLRYAAPEQLRGEKPTPKTDVYAAALVLYEILAGRGPFDHEGDPERIGAAHLHKAPPSIARFVPVPRALEALLTAALSKDPALRPRDAFSFAASLRNLKRSEDATAHAQESTDRDTARASGEVTAPAGPAPESNGQWPLGPYVVTPRPPGTWTATRSPNTTVSGMLAPTVGPGDRTSSGPAHASTASADVSAAPGGIDRAAATRSAVFAVPPAPPEGTEALPPPDPPPSRRDTAPAAMPPLEWPSEAAAFLSDGPQVRSLLAPRAAGHPRRRRLVGALGAAAVLSVGGLALLFRLGTPAPPAAASTGPLELLPRTPPRAVPLAVLPVATLAVDALDAPPAASSPPHPPSPGAAPPPPPSASTARSARSPAPVVPPPKRLATSASAAPLHANPFVQSVGSASPYPSLDRPGPGF